MSLSDVLLRHFRDADVTQPGPRPQKVIVIGAGLAGLSAARILHDAGIETVLLEGRDRIGGRVWTMSLGGCAMDMNGGYLHDSDVNALVRVYQEQKWAYTESSFIDPHANAFDAINGHSLGRVAKVRLAYHLLRYFKGPDDKPTTAAGDYPVETWTQRYFTDASMSGSDGRLIESMLRSKQSTDGRELSMRWYGQLPVRGDGKWIVPCEGFGRLTSALAHGLDIRLLRPVGPIEHRGTEMHVRSGDEIFNGTHIIVTVPIGVLQAHRLDFHPPLSPSKSSAIARIGVALMEKLVFLFSGPFSRDFSSLVYFDGATGCRLTFQNHSKGLGRPIVVAYAHTDYVSEFATLESAKRRAIVLFALASMLGTQLPEIEGSVQSDWTNDPFSLGAYSFIKVHSGPEDIAELASPEYGGQLLFAGEATHVNRHAHVEGAVASGVREARRLLNL